MGRKRKGLSFLEASFVKRPDLRLDEFSDSVLDETSDDEAMFAQGANWQWWIPTWKLVSEEFKNYPGLHRNSVAVPVLPEFCEQIDPIEILAIFCSCHEWRVYPPAWVLNALHERFEAYLKDNFDGRSRRLGEYFGEPSEGTRRGVFRQFYTSSLTEQAHRIVDCLVYWFSRKQNAALDIAAIYLQLRQERSPKGWQGEKIKGREALRKSYLAWKRSGETDRFLKNMERCPPTTEDRLFILKALGSDCLQGHPDLIDLLRGAKR
jgi:hypothetical protein